MAGSRIFISYRRGSGSAPARHLAGRLGAEFGEDCALTDIDAIDPGADFLDYIDEAVGRCDVLIALIGDEWLDCRDEAGNRRLDDPEDFVRLEVAAALKCDLRVIPVLVGGAEMPRAHELPKSLQRLARRNALEVTDSRWHHDVGRLIETIREILEGKRASYDASPATALDRRLGTGLSALLRAGARSGVMPEGALGPFDAPAAAAAPRAASYPLASPAPSGGLPGEVSRYRRAQSPLTRLLLLALPLAGIAMLVRWLAGCMIEGSDSERAVEVIQCSVFAPPSAAPGNSLLVQVFAHLPLQATDAWALAEEFDTTAARRSFKTLAAPVERGETLGVQLELRGLTVDEPAQSLVWRGRPEAVQFAVEVPAGLEPRTVVGTVTLVRNSTPVGHVKFTLKIEAGQPARGPEGQGEAASRYRKAFVSYASRDREAVLRGVQMLRAVGIRCFQDVVDLDPGDRWERRLYTNIEESDLFLLFWSRAAQESEWVKKETLYALALKAGELDPPEIRPVILERPPAEPWPEVAHIHFNDPLVYFMAPPN